MPVINQAKNRAGLHAGRVKGKLWRQNHFAGFAPIRRDQDSRFPAALPAPGIENTAQFPSGETARRHAACGLILLPN